MSAGLILAFIGFVGLVVVGRWIVTDLRDGVFRFRLNTGRTFGEIDRAEKPFLFWGLHLFQLAIVLTLVMVAAKLAISP